MCLFIISKRTAAMVQRWQEFGHSEGQAPGSCVTAIHRQPFPVPRYSVISYVPGVASVVQNQFLHLCYDHNHPRRAGLIGAIVILVSVRPYSNTLRHFLTSCTLITSSPYRNTFRPQNSNHIQTPQEQFPNVLPLHINWSSDWHLCHLLRVSPTTGATFYPKVECLISTKTYRVVRYNYGMRVVRVSALRGNTAFTVRHHINRAELHHSQGYHLPSQHSESLQRLERMAATNHHK